jgi:hypothetical protein
MKDAYLKGYWAEETLWIFQHYQDQYVVRQINVYPAQTIYLSVENPIQGKDFLDDQPLERIDTSMVEFITKEEFEKVWNRQKEWKSN